MRGFSKLIPVLILLSLLLNACAPVATPTQAPAPTTAPAQAATTAPEPTAVPPTEAPATTAPEPTAAPTEAPTAAPEPTATTAASASELILATTTSTADSGLLDFILPDFEQKFNAKVNVIAVGTGQALEIGSKGDADVLLVHSRKGEDQFVADGNATRRDDVMYNDFVIVGPKDDPAKIAAMTTAKDAFKAIMDAEQTFVSRGDKSGTNTKELSIWTSIQVTPTADMPWYNAIGQGMGDTLLFANEKQGYTLTDRGTWLSMLDKLPDLTILVGGQTLAENKDKTLLNPYGVLAVNPEKHPNVKAELAQQFISWILSKETQKVIGEYGVDKFGQPLFYPNSEEYKSTDAVSVTVGDTTKTLTLADLQALPKVAAQSYEAIGHKKGPLGVNDWAGASLKDVLLAVDASAADETNDGKLIVVTASDGWVSKLRWSEVFGEPMGGQALADSYGCTECHGMLGEGTAPKGKTPTPAIANKNWSFEALSMILRQSHGAINPYTPEQMSDEDIKEIALWLQDIEAPAPDGAYVVPADQMTTLLAYMLNDEPMTGRDGLIQMIKVADKYSSRYAHWVAKIELK